MDKLNSDLNAFIVPVEILTLEGLTIYEKMAYIVIRSFCNPRDNSAFPSYKTIAENGSMSRDSAMNAVKGLEQKGLLIKKTNLTVTAERKITNATNTYTLVAHSHHPSGSQPLPLVAHSHHPSGSQPPYKDLKDLKDLREIKRDDKEIDSCLSTFSISDEQKEKIKQKILHNKTKIHNLQSYVEKMIGNETKTKTKRPDVKMVTVQEDDNVDIEAIRRKAKEYEQSILRK